MALLTTNPARGLCPGRDEGAVSSDARLRWTTRRGLAARDPRRTVSLKSRLRRNRALRGSTVAGGSGRTVRPTARSDPCGGGPRGSSDRHACACGGGSRGSWPVGGCSAGKCACSSGRLRTVVRRPGVWPGVGDRPGPVGLAAAGGWSAGHHRTPTPRSPEVREARCAGMRRRPPSSYRACRTAPAEAGHGSSQVRTDVGPSTVRVLARGGQTATTWSRPQDPYPANRPSSPP